MWCAQVNARMNYASKLLRDFARSKGETGFGRQWRFNTTKLRLKGGKFCHFSGKGWQCGMIIQWLNDFLQSNNVPVHQNVKTAVWAADNFIGFLHETKKRGLFLTQQEAEQIQAVGFLFLSTYLCLHVQFKRFCVYRLYNLRPKFHMLTHLIDDCQLLKNPCLAATWQDESWLKTILCVAKKTHKRRANRSILTRYLAGQNIIAALQAPMYHSRRVAQDWNTLWNVCKSPALSCISFQIVDAFKSCMFYDGHDGSRPCVLVITQFMPTFFSWSWWFMLMFFKIMVVHVHACLWPCWFMRSLFNVHAVMPMLLHVHGGSFTWFMYITHVFMMLMPMLLLIKAAHVHTSFSFPALACSSEGASFVSMCLFVWFPGARSMCKWGSTIATWFAPMILENGSAAVWKVLRLTYCVDHFHLQFTDFKNIPPPGFSLGNGCFVGVLLRKAPSR